MLDDNVLNQQGNNYQALAIKARHLSTQNNQLHQTLSNLQTQLHSLRVVNQQLINNNPKEIQNIIDQLSKQNQNLEEALFRLIKNNQEASCDILMKNQLLAQNEHEYREVVSNYQAKIYDLRISLQAKESFVTQVEEKILTEKDQSFNTPTRANLMYFNQMNQLKLLLERFIVENSELHLLNLSKNEEIQTLTHKLKTCQSVLKNSQNYTHYQAKLHTVFHKDHSDRTKTQPLTSARLRLEEELTRYDAKYKSISFHTNRQRKNDAASHIYELKLLITKIYRDRWTIAEEKAKLVKKIARKEEELKSLRQAFKKTQQELQQGKVEVEYYRENFKQLTKVTTQRKIKFYEQHYNESLPTLQKKLNQKKQLISHLKNWHSQAQDNQHVRERRMMNKKLKSMKAIKNNRPSTSCPPKMIHFDKPSKRTCSHQKEVNIFGFINQEANSLFSDILEGQLGKSNDPELFQGEISVIKKPSKVKDSTKPFFKKELVLQLQDF